MNTRSMRLWIGLAFVACIMAGGASASAQQTSRVALSARYGWAPTRAPDAATGVGFEVDVAISTALVSTIRFDGWNFGFSCIGPDPCANGFTTIAVGGKYRIAGSPSVVPYLGAEVGYTEWTSDATGPSLRMRAGLDVRLIRHVDLSLDGTQMRFFDRGDTGPLPQKQLFGFSGGLRVWL